MDLEAFSDALDLALTDVAESEFNRLSRGLNASSLVAKIHGSLEALRKLREGQPPDYRDPWVALLYLTWYQAGQIQLAYSQIKSLCNCRPTNGLTVDHNTPLRIVDFGCGTRAMQFALAWVAAENMEAGHSIPVIYIYGHDSSTEMVSLGDLVWRRFNTELGNREEFNHLGNFLGAIRPRSDLNDLLSGPGGRGERWFGAMHVVYESNTSAIRAGLARFLRDFDPDVAFVSSHSDQGSKSRLVSICPYGEDKYGSFSTEFRSEITLDLPRITAWRRQLNARISNTHRFLDSQVDWAFRESFGLTYIKRG